MLSNPRSATLEAVPSGLPAPALGFADLRHGDPAWARALLARQRAPGYLQPSACTSVSTDR